MLPVQTIREKFLKNPISCLIPTENASKEITNNLVDFIKQYFAKHQFKNAIIGLSGGVDSSFLAYLSVKALGQDNVYGVLLPSEFTSSDHIEKALKICDELKIKHNNYSNIKKDFDIVSTIIEHMGEMSKDAKIQRLKYGNIQARIRMILLRDIAKNKNGLVIGTTNKTEMELGYATIAGDGLGGNDIEPIADLYKTTEKHIARYIGVSDEIIDQKATAELWYGQTDEGEIGLEYELIDQILLGIELGISNDKIIKAISNQKITPEQIDKIKKQISDNLYKNRFPETDNTNFYS